MITAHQANSGTGSNTQRELVVDLEPALAVDGSFYKASVIGHAADDGHWNAWLEFVETGTQTVLRTGIETHQAADRDLQRWAAGLSSIYLEGALERARRSPVETALHRRAFDQAGLRPRRNPQVDPFALFGLGPHVLRRELQLFDRNALRAIVRAHHLNPGGVPISTFTRAQMAIFIVTAVEAQHRRVS